MAAVIEIYNRPTEQGLYWIEVNLPRPMKYAQAEQYFADMPKSSQLPGKGAAGMLYYKDSAWGGNGQVDPANAAAIIAAGQGSTLEWRDRKVGLQGTQQQVDKVCYYVYQDSNIPVPSGLSDVSVTLLGRDEVIEERDSSGAVYRPPSSVQGLGALPALLSIPLFVALSALGLAIVGWVANLLGISLIPKAITQPIVKGSQALSDMLATVSKIATAIGNKADDFLDKASDAVSDIGTGLAWGVGIAAGLAILLSSSSDEEDD